MKIEITEAQQQILVNLIRQVKVSLDEVQVIQDLLKVVTTPITEEKK